MHRAESDPPRFHEAVLQIVMHCDEVGYNSPVLSFACFQQKLNGRCSGEQRRREDSHIIPHCYPLTGASGADSVSFWSADSVSALRVPNGQVSHGLVRTNHEDRLRRVQPDSDVRKHEKDNEGRRQHDKAVSPRQGVRAEGVRAKGEVSQDEAGYAHEDERDGRLPPGAMPASAARLRTVNAANVTVPRTTAPARASQRRRLANAD